MRATVTLDDDLLAKAKDYTEITKTSAVGHVALRALVQREAARQLAKLGGSQPNIRAASDHRPPATQ